MENHQAGDYLAPEANLLFRRYTDQVIKWTLDKQPLDVGSNFIARTAHYALALIEKISQQTSENIPLAWSADFSTKVAAVETYPAATLLALQIPHARYKQDKSARKKLLEDLQTIMTFSCDTSMMIEKDDVFDAVLCVLTGKDFMQGLCLGPDEEELPLAHKEGWIWVRDP